MKPIGGLRVLTTWLKFLSDPIPVMRSLYAERGPVVAFRDGSGRSRQPRLFVLAVGPEYNEQILGNTEIFRSRGLVLQGPKGSAHERIRFGLISMNGDQHQWHRTLLMPAFRRSSVEGYRDTIVELTDQVLHTWKAGERRDILEDMRLLALHVASTILFGYSGAVEAYRIGRMIEKWLKTCFTRRVWFLPFNLPGMPYRGLLRRAEELEKALRSMIDNRRHASMGAEDVLSVLSQARENDSRITDDELVGQVNVLFTAAHETNTVALTWTLFLLSQHPQAAQDLLDELAGKLHGDPPTVEQFASLPLLDRVIKESLRLIPPVVWSTRIVDESVQLGPYVLSKGSRVLYSQFMTHHLPGLYPNPEKFDPDRWVRMEPSPYEFLPFGAGPRMCIGYAFSMTMLKVTLAMILQRYRLSLIPGTTIDRAYAVTLSPRYGMPMQIHGQDRNYSQVPVRGNIHEIVDLPRT